VISPEFTPMASTWHRSLEQAVSARPQNRNLNEEPWTMNRTVPLGLCGGALCAPSPRRPSPRDTRPIPAPHDPPSTPIDVTFAPQQNQRLPFPMPPFFDTLFPPPTRCRPHTFRGLRKNNRPGRRRCLPAGGPSSRMPGCSLEYSIPGLERSVLESNTPGPRVLEC
jgi:hypothetical protein